MTLAFLGIVFLLVWFAISVMALGILSMVSTGLSAGGTTAQTI